MISRIFAADVLREAPERWRRQYGVEYYANNTGKVEKTLKLMALKWPFTKEQIDGVIGNDSWTEHKCSECNTHCETLVRIGDEPDYDARWVDLCAQCLAKACAA